jgi:hypothetical protein
VPENSTAILSSYPEEEDLRRRRIRGGKET